MKRWGVLIICFLAVFFSCTPSSKYLLKKNYKLSIDKEYIRVLLLKTVDSVEIKSDSEMKITDKKTGKIVSEKKDRLMMNPDNVNNPIFLESKNAQISLNGNSYRGMLEIHNVMGKLWVINKLRIDEYLLSVVPAEIPSSWNIEALKAQAVAARTYTYYHLARNKQALYDLDSSNKSQMYRGIAVENNASSDAVLKTSGEVITFNNDPILSYFHSTCGGKTIDDKYVWKKSDLEYLKSKKCDFCKESTKYSWETHLSLSDMKKYLSKKFHGIGKIKKISFNKESGRITDVTIIHSNGMLNITGNDFRLAFPETVIRSTFFNAKKNKDGFLLSGKGWGHGVGMCQWGAKGMAEKGYNYKSILKNYYSNIEIIKINDKIVATKVKKTESIQ
jgi:stage II sporulation protein D